MYLFFPCPFDTPNYHPSKAIVIYMSFIYTLYLKLEVKGESSPSVIAGQNAYAKKTTTQ